MEDTNLTPITQDSPFRLPHDEAIIAAKRREIAARYPSFIALGIAESYSGSAPTHSR